MLRAVGVTCIVVTAQGCDQLSVMIFGNAWGLQVTPRPRFVASCPHAWACGGSAPFSTVAAQPGGTIISAGYLLTVALTAPMAMIDISEGFQFASYAISLACLVWLIVKFWVLAAHGGASGDAGDNVFPPVFTWHTGLALEVNFWVRSTRYGSVATCVRYANERATPSMAELGDLVCGSDVFGREGGGCAAC